MDVNTVWSGADQKKNIDQHQSALGVKNWTNIKQICGSYWIAGLREDGTVKVLGSSLDANKKSLLLVDSWTDITQIAMGEAHFVGLKSDGTMVATGSNHCGQCDVETWKNVVFVDAANQCTIGMT